ncbi:SAM (and some other nucleotide) binding motif:Site-specific DNA-methyltransferase (cytosine-N4-specific):N-6 [Fulvimarina pelagi HTCC2506]|uniref:SAM (And some other nucleotide) binding motif:Site-specific DNA-methyltransferase (Cytosine-N4-specific):N-6 n=1 Tax=Fulvimarina pelagi HTCC2506 TaxID=314231 RepID=Q0G582_9HYPH|nr:methyltransferase [Fulvimarina pelagi]EAU43182.1 SAM (and some other nucleotide) binding motif:Site-specific DNA-methyltransferase (cytosine-N4-specific):N-6 [Fulvimarina pelagi HTCC2506]
MSSRPAVETGAVPIGSLETRTDAFYDGRFHLVQPKRVGYRSGLDALLLAATVGENASGNLLDIGAGAGAVGFAAAVRAPGLRVALLENDVLMAECARKGLADTGNAAFADRASVIEADLFTIRRAKAGHPMRDQLFDFVVTNPPFYLPGQRPSSDPVRAAAMVAPDADFLRRWVQTSLAFLKDGGRFAAILSPAALAICLPALSGRIGGPAVTPIHGHRGEPAIRLILTGRKSSRESLSFLPLRYLFDSGRAPSDFTGRLSRGQVHFGWPRTNERQEGPDERVDPAVLEDHIRP